jgi:hypothetical protein
LGVEPIAIKTHVYCEGKNRLSSSSGLAVRLVKTYHMSEPSELGSGPVMHC